MGTKNNPGAFDCYANAEPDEPMFVLLGRDIHAPEVVRFWVELRLLEGESAEKTGEALDCAEAMERYRAKREEERYANTITNKTEGR